MELLIIVVVLILAGALIRLHLIRMEERSKELKITSDLEQIADRIQILYDHTGTDPGHVSREPCVRGVEVSLESCRAGLKCTDGAFPNWQGPYLKELPEDVWGGSYHFNADYLCKKQTTGCQEVPNTTKVRAILSAGPDGDLETLKDNIVHIICK